MRAALLLAAGGCCAFGLGVYVEGRRHAAPAVAVDPQRSCISTMRAPDEKALRKAITSGHIAPVYFFYGDDEFRKDEAVAALLAAAVPAESRDFNVETRRTGDLDGEALETLLGTPPLMAPRRALALRDIGSIKKDTYRVLLSYVERPAQDVVLVMVATSDTKLDPALRNGGVAVEFKPLTGQDLQDWVARRAGLMGATITPEAYGLLHEAAGEDLATFVSELDKLVSFVQGARSLSEPTSKVTIDTDAVEGVVGVRRGETMSDLLDRIAMRDAAGALALVDHVLAQPKTTAVSLVMALTTQTLALGWGRARLDRGTRANRLEQEYFSLLRDTRAFPMRPWGEAAAAWARATDRWTLASVERALRALEAADAALKETRVSSDEQVIAALILTMCAGAEVPLTPRAGTGVAA